MTEQLSDSTAAPLFSVVMPTRDRPELFAAALESVLAQEDCDLEVIVVNDGSSDDNWSRYATAAALDDKRVTVLSLPQRAQGHGPAFAINTGAARARGHYLCFLDDDDTWTDATHLANVARWIEVAATTVDAVYTNQHAFRDDGSRVELKLWLNPLGDRYATGQAHSVDAAALLKAGSFPHLNCTIIRREHFDAVGGFDDGIRYECEVDLYLRVIDAAATLLYAPVYIARHNVPAGANRGSESERVDTVRKRLSQAHVYTKNHLLAQNPDVRGAARARLGDIYRELSEEFSRRGDRQRAYSFARLGQGSRPTFRWGVKTLLLGLRATVGGR